MATLDDFADFDLDRELEAAQLQPEFIDPATGIYFLRPAQIELKVMTNNEDEDTLVAAFVYQVVGAEDPALEYLANGLLGENFRLSGEGIQDTEKMSAEDQKALGLSQFKTRLAALGANNFKGAAGDRIKALLAYYHGKEKRLMRVHIKAKEKDGYMNIKSFRVLDADVSISDVEGLDMASYTPWYPNAKS